MSRHPVDEVLSHEVVVVGSGVAGLRAALGSAQRPVAILTKSGFGLGGSSPAAQGGVAAAVGQSDSPALHAADTLAAAAELADPAVVRQLTREGPAEVFRLATLGARFDRDAADRLALGREGAHSRPRILHAGGDATGAEMVRALVEAVGSHPGIEIFEHAFAADLVRVRGRVVGVVARHADGRRVLHLARATVLATGGYGRLYSHTTNPVEVTGDGLAMAARAGARLVDLEFVQFHPTALEVGRDPMPLVTEALRGAGAVLVDGRGDPFMGAVHPAADLAPRDIVARAIWQRRQAGERVYLDAREAVGAELPERFPTVYGLCRREGIDPRSEPIPVAPAAHYTMGGIWVDGCGRTSLPGLWASGEVTSSGAHGANRLASNSLLEALVFGARVAEDVDDRLTGARPAGELPATALGRASHFGPHELGGSAEAARLAELRALAWRELGLVRCESGLAAAESELERLRAEAGAGASELHNLLTVATLVTRAARERVESRGSHFRSDYPETLPSWRRRLVWEGARRCGSLPVDGSPREREAAEVAT